MLCSLLKKHYGQKPILLIDEYDVPLDKSFHYGYYDQMLDLIRARFGSALKINDSLFFAVLTGGLRVPKESFFSGLNNLMVHSISDVKFDKLDANFKASSCVKTFLSMDLNQASNEKQSWGKSIVSISQKS